MWEKVSTLTHFLSSLAYSVSIFPPLFFWPPSHDLERKRKFTFDFQIDSEMPAKHLRQSDHDHIHPHSSSTGSPISVSSPISSSVALSPFAAHQNQNQTTELGGSSFLIPSLPFYPDSSGWKASSLEEDEGFFPLFWERLYIVEVLVVFSKKKKYKPANETSTWNSYLQLNAVFPDEMILSTITTQFLRCRAKSNAIDMQAPSNDALREKTYCRENWTRKFLKELTSFRRFHASLLSL